jgi:hypothetical protein
MGGLLLVCLNRTEVLKYSGSRFLQFKCCFHNELFKNAANPGALWPCISLRAGFLGEQFAPACF